MFTNARNGKPSRRSNSEGGERRAGFGRPLLIKGEPGTGKTLPAEAVRDALAALTHLACEEYIPCPDGLYVYDAIQRLHDGRFGDKDVGDIRQYIRFGALGQAFVNEEESIVLIDEIDKADLSFPMTCYTNSTKWRSRFWRPAITMWPSIALIMSPQQ